MYKGKERHEKTKPFRVRALTDEISRLFFRESEFNDAVARPLYSAV